MTCPEITEEYGGKDTHTLTERREERSQQRSQVTEAKKENKQTNVSQRSGHDRIPQVEF